MYDTSGQASTFFQYCGVVKVDLAAFVTQSIVNGDDKIVIEECRKGVVGAMRNGNTVAFHSDKLSPDFNEKYKGDENNFPSDCVFNKEEW